MAPRADDLVISFLGVQRGRIVLNWWSVVGGFGAALEVDDLREGMDFE
jgi:hypothetical protein